MLPNGIITSAVGPLGNLTDVASVPPGNGTMLITIASANIVVLASSNTSVRIVAGTNATTGNFSGDGANATRAGLNRPAGVAVDASNPSRFWIADAGGWRRSALQELRLPGQRSRSGQDRTHFPLFLFLSP